jgi:hypothetical protein
MKAEASFDAHGRVALRFPYSKWLVEHLKLHVPASGREYRPESKTWLVSSSWAGVAVSLARQAFPDIETIRDEPARPRLTVVGGRDDDHCVLYVAKDATPEVVDAAYRALSRKLHPDLGGDTAGMQRLNAAYERLKGGRRTGAA